MSKAISIVIVGRSSGKSGLAHVFAKKKYNFDDATPTHGFNTFTQNISFEEDEDPVKITVMDTSGLGKERPDIIGYVQKSDATVVVFDLTNKNNFEDIAKKWCDDVCAAVASQGSGKFFLLVGNKIDKDGRKVTAEEANNFVSALQQKGANFSCMDYKETSGIADPSGARKMFLDLARKIAEKRGYCKVQKKTQEVALSSTPDGTSAVTPRDSCCVVS